MNQDVVREAVRDRYGRIAKEGEEGCCGPSCCGGSESRIADLVLGPRL